jgi:hypothetical protein
MEFPSSVRLQSITQKLFASRALWIVLCLLATAEFVVRGPWRGYRDASDFVYILDSSRCWTYGLNPYLPADLSACSLIQSPEAGYEYTPQVHPPATLLLLSPLARLPLPAARFLWITLLLILTIVAGVRLARAAPRWDLRTSTFLIAFSPVHTGLFLGQTSIATCMLIAISLTVEQPWLAGILLGLAACFKWHLAAWFILLAAWNNWRRCVAACLTAGGLMAAAIACLKAGSMATWFAAMTSLSAGSGLGSGSSANPMSYQLLNADALLPQLLQIRSMIVVLYAAIFAFTAAAVARTRDRWTAIAVTAAASTLVAYHRFYDGSILCLAIPALLLLPRKFRWLWLCFAAFLLPGQRMAANWMSSSIHGPFTYLLFRHEVIACLLIWATFTFSALRRGSKPAEAAGAADAPVADLAS